MKRKFKKAAAAILLAFMTTIALPCISFAGGGDAADSHLVAHYAFDGDFKDSSGNGNDGTSVGDVSFADNGVFGKSAVFNGGWVNVESAPALNLGNNFTVSVWVEVSPVMSDNGNKNGPIISKLDENGNYNNYNIYTRGTFGVRLDGRTTAGEVNLQTGPFQDWDLHNWSHIVVSCDGNALYLYNNGVLKSSKPLKKDQALKSSENLMRIGTGNDLNNSNLFYMGRMDDMRIYDRALTDSEIKGLFNAPWHRIVLKMKNPNMTVDGVVREIDPGKGTSPVAINGRSMVPIRAIIEAMGGNLTWTAAEQRLDITLKSKVLKLWINKNTADLDGKDLKMEVPPKIINGRTMVPLRFVSESMGSPVIWDAQTQQITILYLP
ncbi:MAG TPA: stalk domain-containing protein [Desulfobacteria bacterium]|nr:stalk domain-containing protein [Desulfobacteria bacterium]